ncbi:nucleotidyltransferase family protein [Methylocaldum szegediense]|nr:nucleotidyltransferase family protein [Methylocaldum szegediense]
MKNWKVVAVSPDASMKETLAAIDKGAMQIALVVDGDDHLLGTVTDGDIRRALLRGETMETPTQKFMNTNPYTGLVDEDKEIWQRTMQRHSLRHLPLLDSTGRICGLVSYVPPAEPLRENPVVLMAGGLGTRLRPLTDAQPKPLLKIGEKPILETIIENFVTQGFYRFYICLNYKGDMIRGHFGDGRRWGAQITYIEERQRMGTAGALSLLPEPPDRPFFVMNGDLLTKVDFVRLLQFHQRNHAAATLCVREHTDTVPYGVVQLDGYEVKSLIEKPTQRYYVNAGIYVLDPEVVRRIPDGGYYDMPILINDLLRDERPIYSFPLREYWIDIGRMGDFEQAQTDYCAVWETP